MKIHIGDKVKGNKFNPHINGEVKSIVIDEFDTSVPSADNIMYPNAIVWLDGGVSCFAKDIKSIYC